MFRKGRYVTTTLLVRANQSRYEHALDSARGIHGEEGKLRFFLLVSLSAIVVTLGLLTALPFTIIETPLCLFKKNNVLRTYRRYYCRHCR